MTSQRSTIKQLLLYIIVHLICACKGVLGRTVKALAIKRNLVKDNQPDPSSSDADAFLLISQLKKNVK